MKRIESALQKCNQPVVAELLKSYLTEQYAKSARKGKFKLSDFCDMKDYDRSWKWGIYHENGYKIATDAHLLAVLREDYPIEWEGKTIHAKNGTEIEGKYPNYNAIRPKLVKQCYREIVLPDLDMKDLTARLKLAKNTGDYAYYQIEIEGVRFPISAILRFYPVISRIGGKVYISNQTRPIYVVNDSDEWALMMPCQCEDLKDTFLIKWE